MSLLTSENVVVVVSAFERARDLIVAVEVIDAEAAALLAARVAAAIDGAIKGVEMRRTVVGLPKPKTPAAPRAPKALSPDDQAARMTVLATIGASRGVLTTPEAIRGTTIPIENGVRFLSAMVAEGLIARHGAGRKTRWGAPPAQALSAS